MASVIRVDSVQGTNGANYMTNGYLQRPGTIIETLTSVCDGSSVTVGSGTYTFQNVGGGQYATDTWTDVSGSLMSYTPPVGTTRIKYTYDFAWRYDSSGPILHVGLYLDGNEIIYARRNYATEGTSYPEIAGSYTWVFAIGGSTDFNTGKISSWNIGRTIKLMTFIIFFTF